MSDPYMVMTLIDDRPVDPDSESQPEIYEFNGPGEAQAFYLAAVGLIEREVEPGTILVQVFEPVPITRFGNSDDALMHFRDRVSE